MSLLFLRNVGVSPQWPHETGYNRQINMTSSNNEPIMRETIVARRIIVIRSQKVMIDSDLAEIYSVTTKRFNEQVRRNIKRFPSDFMFQLTSDEKAWVVANCDHLQNLKYSPHLPYVFTEHGAIMAASVLNSAKAVEMSVFVVRAFVRMREILSTHKQLAKKLEELEEKVTDHDQAISGLIGAIRELMSSGAGEPKSIGFTADIHKKDG